MFQYRHALFLFIMILLVALVWGKEGMPEAAAEPENLSANAGWEAFGDGSSSGSIGNAGDNELKPSLAVAADGTPIVAWHDDSDGDYEIYVRRWNGSAWIQMGAGSASGGGISNNDGDSYDPSLAVAPDGTPFIAWHDDSGRDGTEIYIRRWNGAGWVETNSGSASGGGISNNSGRSQAPSLAVAPDGAPIVAWMGSTAGDWEIFVRRWNGSTWVEMGSGSGSGGGISNDDSASYEPSLAIAPDSAPIVAWADYESSDIYVKRWNGSAWVEMGSGSASGGGISNTDGASSYDPSLTVTPDGAPIVAWEERGDEEIYIRRFNGSTWVEMGSGSASGGGISNNAGGSYDPSLTVTPDGTPIVAWSDGSSCGSYEIYVLSWNGSAWVEMGNGSAFDCGISDSAGYSQVPSLGVATDGTPIVAWLEDNDGDEAIYVRYKPPIICYILARDHTGQGGDPTATPANSTNCVTGQYTAGQPITLTAAPSSGWRVKNWSGTTNDGSTATTNTATMPAGNHAVSVTYEAVPLNCYTLARSHSGQGGNPSSNPNNSTGCATGQYTAGQSISLTAAPSSGWRVKNWSGTTNNSSTATSNSVIMPAGNHSVIVAYEVIPATSNRLYAPVISYIIGLPLTCFPGLGEVEPNDIFLDANGPLCTSGAYSGLPNDLNDLFSFDAGTGTISIELTGHVGEGLQLILYRGTTEVDKDFGPKAVLQVEHPATPGRYYIRIYAATPKPQSTQQYSLQVLYPPAD